MQNPIYKTISTNLNWWKWETKPPPASIYHSWEASKHDAKARYYSSTHADAERALLASTLKRLTLASRITSSSVVHDDSPHAGSATSVLLDMLDPRFMDEIPEVSISATSQRAVDNANECYENWAPRIAVLKTESRDLSSVPDDKFTHSIALFDVFQFPHIDEMKKSLLWNGIRDSMTVGWSDEEKGRWPAAVEEAIQKEIEQYGGVLFEAWTAIAQK